MTDPVSLMVGTLGVTAVISRQIEVESQQERLYMQAEEGLDLFGGDRSKDEKVYLWEDIKYDEETGEISYDSNVVYSKPKELRDYLGRGAFFAQYSEFYRECRPEKEEEGPGALEEICVEGRRVLGKLKEHMKGDGPDSSKDGSEMPMRMIA